MREIELVILDQDNNFLGNLDLENFTDFPLSLNKGISDINDISRRETFYSLDFELPATPRNNKILFGVAYVNAIGDSTKIISKNKCRVLVDGNQTENGFIRIFASSKDGKYKANFTGGNGDWVEQLDDTDLNQLNWVAELNSGTETAAETFSQARVDAVNALDSTSVDIVYPYVIRDVGSELDFEALKPQLYVRSIVLRMFEKIGYSVDSNFLDSEYVKGVVDGSIEYKGLAIDPTTNFSIDEDTLNQRRAEAATTAGSFQNQYLLGNNGAGGLRYETRMNSYWDNEISDQGSNFTVSTSTYNVPVNGKYEIVLDGNTVRYQDLSNGIDYFLPPSADIVPPEVAFVIVRNNVSTTVIDGEVMTEVSMSRALPGNGWDMNPKAKVTLAQNDNVSIWVRIYDNADSVYPALRDLNNWNFHLGLNAKVRFTPVQSIQEGDTYSINSVIPKDVSCLKVLQDLKTMHNLYFDTDTALKTVRIEPRDDFYQNIGQAKNITQDIDLTKEITINVLNQYPRRMIFKYASDSSDGYLERWQKINDRIYGKYIHDFGEDYEKGSLTYQTRLISPTIQGVMPNANTVTSIIRREWDDTKEPDDINQEYNMRIFQIVRNVQEDDAGNDRRTTPPTLVTCAIMESFGGVPTYNDWKLTFNGEGGLVERFFSKTIKNIELKRSVNLYWKMPLGDFRSLDLSRPVFIDHTLPKIQGYYIIENVSNYKLATYESVKVKLLKYKDYQPIEIDPSQETNINENTSDGQDNELDYLYFVNDEGTINESYDQVFDLSNQGNFIPLYNE